MKRFAPHRGRPRSVGPRSYCPQLLGLEDRLLPGESALTLVLGTALADAGLTVPGLDSGSRQRTAPRQAAEVGPTGGAVAPAAAPGIAAAQAAAGTPPLPLPTGPGRPAADAALLAAVAAVVPVDAVAPDTGETCGEACGGCCAADGEALAGPRGGGHVQGDPALVGQWGEVVPWKIEALHMALLPNSKVFLWDMRRITDPTFVPYLWDPADGSMQALPPPPTSFYCPGFSLMADGRLLIAGGGDDKYGEPKHAVIFDPADASWTYLPDMNDNRWYGSTTALPSGDVLAIAGAIGSTKKGKPIMNEVPQVWDVRAAAWRDLDGARRVLDMYPQLFVTGDGRVFNAGHLQDTYYLDTSGRGSWEWVAANNHGNRYYGGAVLYDDGKVLINGGTYEDTDDLLPTDTTEVIDLNAARPAWRYTNAMNYPRHHHYNTLLPDGQVLATGGVASAGSVGYETDPVYEAEVWDPTTEEWTPLAAMTDPRWYHSSALLLPDARVLVAGGNEVWTSQIYSPPYLFRGPRPRIDAAPARVGYGETFTVQTPDAGRVAQVTLVKLGTVTHAVNFEQRINHLRSAPGSGEVQVQAPSGPNAAPPGHYMLFLVDGMGVPSEARFVHIG